MGSAAPDPSSTCQDGATHLSGWTHAAIGSPRCVGDADQVLTDADWG